MELGTRLAFFAAAWAISISPGAGAVAAISAGVNHGFARGCWLSLGLTFGIRTQLLVVLDLDRPLGTRYPPSPPRRPLPIWW